MWHKMAVDSQLGRVGSIDDVGKAAAFLLSEDAGFVSGSVLQVDGGLLCGYK